MKVGLLGCKNCTPSIICDISFWDWLVGWFAEHELAKRKIQKQGEDQENWMGGTHCEVNLIFGRIWKENSRHFSNIRSLSATQLTEGCAKLTNLEVRFSLQERSFMWNCRRDCKVDVVYSFILTAIEWIPLIFNVQLNDCIGRWFFASLKVFYMISTQVNFSKQHHILYYEICFTSFSKHE